MELALIANGECWSTEIRCQLPMSFRMFVNEGAPNPGFWITVGCAMKRVKARNTAKFPLPEALHCTFTHCAVGCNLQMLNHRNLLSHADGVPNVVNKAVKEVRLVFGG